MLVLSRKQGESIECDWNGTKVVFKIESISGNRVKVSIDAPRDIIVRRTEVINKTLPQAERPMTNVDG